MSFGTPSRTQNGRLASAAADGAQAHALPVLHHVADGAVVVERHRAPAAARQRTYAATFPAMLSGSTKRRRLRVADRPSSRSPPACRRRRSRRPGSCRSRGSRRSGWPATRRARGAAPARRPSSESRFVGSLEAPGERRRCPAGRRVRSSTRDELEQQVLRVGRRRVLPRAGRRSRGSRRPGPAARSMPLRLDPVEQRVTLWLLPPASVARSPGSTAILTPASGSSGSMSGNGKPVDVAGLLAGRLVDRLPCARRGRGARRSPWSASSKPSSQRQARVRQLDDLVRVVALLVVLQDLRRQQVPRRLGSCRCSSIVAGRDARRGSRPAAASIEQQSHCQTADAVRITAPP